MLDFRQLRARFIVEKVALGHVLSLVSIIAPLLRTLISFTDLLFPPPHGATTPSGTGPPHYRGFTITQAQAHTHIHSFGVLRTSGQADEETSTWQHTTLIRDRHPCARRVSNPQSCQASGRTPTPEAFADHRRYLILANDSAVK